MCPVRKMLEDELKFSFPLDGPMSKYIIGFKLLYCKTQFCMTEKREYVGFQKYEVELKLSETQFTNNNNLSKESNTFLAAILFRNGGNTV